MAESAEEYFFFFPSLLGPDLGSGGDSTLLTMSSEGCMIDFVKAVRREHKEPYFLLLKKVLMALLRLLSCQCLKSHK